MKRLWISVCIALVIATLLGSVFAFSLLAAWRLGAVLAPRYIASVLIEGY